MKTIKPWQVSDAGMAFGQVGNEVPDYKECRLLQEQGQIPSKYEQLVSDWFFSGLAELNAIPREGINTEEAMRCIRAELGSWARKHEHKTLLIAWLFEQWFSDVQWKVKERK
jgi:hypothetical protein